jgi:ribonuclease VapC
MSAFVIDTSVLLAITLEEPDYRSYVNKILFAPAGAAIISTATVLETLTVVFHRKNVASVADMREMLALPMFTVVAPTMPEIDIAYDALLRYGKGNGHPAQLNFGDLFSYAAAKSRGLPLLYKGNDFAQTDIVAA